LKVTKKCNLLKKDEARRQEEQVDADLTARGYQFHGLKPLRSFEVACGAALLASVLACIISHPGDVLLTKTYKGSGSNRGFGDLVSEIYEEQGIEGFFSGISARFLHVGVIITSQLVLYDTVKQLLGLPATGTI
jgi:solute carrier family 25 phosphate transporter 3